MRWLDNITNSMDMNLSKHQETGEQRGLACCSPWGHKELDTSYQLNNNTVFPENTWNTIKLKGE